MTSSREALRSVVKLPKQFKRGGIFLCHNHEVFRHHKWLPSTTYHASVNSCPIYRSFSSKISPSPANLPEDDEDKDDPIEGVNSYTLGLLKLRHEGIIMNPDGIGKDILPGERVIKENKKLMTKRMVQIEQKFGYFWTLKDLNKTNNKPILSNVELIHTDIAKVFPAFGLIDDETEDNRDSIDDTEEKLGEQSTKKISGELQTLTGRPIQTPKCFTLRNRAKDPNAACTLVAINFNDFGYKMLPSWTDPFEKEFGSSKSGNHRFETFWISIHESRILNLISSFIIRSFRKKVPDHRKDKTLLYFGGSASGMRDVLRMHNEKTSYVYLLDGIGRVRFAASGEATKEEAQRLIRFAKKLVPSNRDRTIDSPVKKKREREGSRRIIRKKF